MDEHFGGMRQDVRHDLIAALRRLGIAATMEQVVEAAHAAAGHYSDITLCRATAEMLTALAACKQGKAS
jgi:hypothetical protein